MFLFAGGEEQPLQIQPLMFPLAAFPLKNLHAGQNIEIRHPPGKPLKNNFFSHFLSPFIFRMMHLSGKKRGDHFFHHGCIFVRLGRFAYQRDLNFLFNQFPGQWLEELLGRFQMPALAFLAVGNAGEVGVKFFRQLF